MTEKDWVQCTFPPKLLRYLRGQASDRKLRLFACEAFRLFVETLRRCFPSRALLRLPEKDVLWNAPQVASRFADGLAGPAELRAACNAAAAVYSSHRWLEYACWIAAHPDAWVAADEVDSALRSFVDDELPPLDKATEPSVVVALREDAGDIWQTALIRDVFGNPFRRTTLNPDWLRWNDGAIPKLAQAIYDERAFDRLPVLADALEDAGCDNADILGHCRQPGPHVRGCWAVDLILGKDQDPTRDMTEREWLGCESSLDLLQFLRGRASDRKLRLYACETLRLFLETVTRCFPTEAWRLPENHDPVLEVADMATRFIEGQASAAQLQAASEEAYSYCNGSFHGLSYAAWVTAHPDAWAAAKGVDRELESALYILPPTEEGLGERALVAAFRERGGDRWRVALLRDVFGNPFRPSSVDPSWLAWNNGAVVKLAQEIYDEHASHALPALADALADAGCTDADILSHCRQPGPHVRGCWVVDLILGKS